MKYKGLIVINVKYLRSGLNSAACDTYDLLAPLVWALPIGYGDYIWSCAHKYKGPSF